MASLSDVTTPRLVGGRYQLEVPTGWRIGRGAFGGLVVASLVRAIELHTEDPSRKVRSVTAELPGAVEPGPVDIAVETLRRGNNVSTVRAALSQGGEIRSHAVAVLAAARDGAAAGTAVTALTWNDVPRPVAPPWTEVARVDLGPAGDVPSGGPWPEFAQHFEFRVVEGIPGASSAPRAVGWIRARDPGPERGAAYLAAMIDAWWPAAAIRLGGMRPMATIAFTLEIAGDLEGVEPDAPLLYRAVAPVCSDGYAFETRELWTEAGRLVAQNHQTFVIIR
jgi:acyl-CoA thioesterase